MPTKAQGSLDRERFKSKMPNYFERRQNIEAIIGLSVFAFIGAVGGIVVDTICRANELSLGLAAQTFSAHPWEMSGLAFGGAILIPLFACALVGGFSK